MNKTSHFHCLLSSQNPNQEWWKHENMTETGTHKIWDSVILYLGLQNCSTLKDQLVYDIQLNREASPGQGLVTLMEMTWHAHVNQSSSLRTSESGFPLLPRDFRLGFQISQVNTLCDERKGQCQRLKAARFPVLLSVVVFSF